MNQYPMQPYPQQPQYQPGPPQPQYQPQQFAPAGPPANYPAPQYQQPQQPQYGGMPQYQQPQQQQFAATPTGNIFAGFDGMQINSGNNQNYFRPGRYLVKIMACKTGTSKKSGGDFSAIESVVIKVFDNAQGRGHARGEDVCHFIQKTGPAAPYFKGSICEFIGAMMGMPKENVTVEHAAAVFGSGQPMSAACYIGEVKIQDITTKAQTIRSIPKWIRRVPPAEALLILDNQTREMFFPQNILQFMADQEYKAQIGPPVPPQQDWGSKATPDPVMVAPQPQAPAQPPQQPQYPQQGAPGQYAPQGYGPPPQAPPVQPMMPPPGMYRPAPPAGAPMPPAGPNVAPQQYGPPPAPPMGPPQYVPSPQYGPGPQGYGNPPR